MLGLITDQHKLDSLTAHVQASPRLWINLDLCNFLEDLPHRMSHAFELLKVQDGLNWPTGEEVILIS